MNVKKLSSEVYALPQLCFRAFLLVLAFVNALSPLRPLQAQSLNQTLHELYHTAWSEKDGLYGTVNAITQTPDGFLWIATKVDLYRFDGLTFEPFRPANGMLPDGGPLSLLVAADGALWVAYNGGRVVLIKDGKVQLYSEKDGFPYGYTNALAQTHDGAVWAALNGGLSRFDGKSWHKVRSDWGYLHTAAQCLFVDRQDTLWACSGTDLTYLPSGSHHFRDLGLNVERLVAVSQSQDGLLWYSDGDDEVVKPLRSPLESDSSRLLPRPIPIGCWSILFPKDGGAWFATEHGVKRLPSVAGLLSQANVTAKSAETFDQKDGASGRATYSLFEDREGNVWAGTASGLDRFRKRKLSWIESGGATQVVETNRRDALAFFADDTPPRSLTASHPVPKELAYINNVMIADSSRDGSVWLIARTNTWRWKEGKVEDFSYPKYDRNSRIYAITADLNGAIWASISGLGLMKLVDDVWTSVPVLPGETDVAPSSVSIDENNQLWLGYDNRQCVALLSRGKVAHIFAAADGVSFGPVNVVLPSRSNVWVGGERGLSLLRGNRFERANDENGAPLPAIQYITDTPHDGLWFVSARGIVHIFEKDLQAYLRRATAGIRYEVLDTRSDLPEPLSTGAATYGGVTFQQQTDVSPRGKLWFVTNNGDASIDLDNLRRNASVPPVVITSLQTDQRRYALDKSITLAPDTHSLTLTYTALSLTDAPRNRFKVRLDNWDEQWKDVGSRRESVYGNLAPGKYTFHVIASNNDGLWNETGAALSFTVLPAFYQTYWFRIFCLTALVILASVMYTWRVQSLIKRSNDLLLERLSERERIAHDLHDTFLQSVQGLLLRFHSATGRLSLGDPTRGLFEDTLKQSDGVMLEGRGLVMDLHTVARAPGDLLDALRSIGAEYKAYNPVAFSVSVAGRVRPVQAIVSRELYSFASEALSNAFRHSRAQNISVEVRYDDRQLLVSFRDDGQGIAPEILEAGHLVGHWGLQGMKDRAKRMGSHLGLVSSVNSGTQITLAIPADIAYMEKRPFLFHILTPRE